MTQGKYLERKKFELQGKEPEKGQITKGRQSKINLIEQRDRLWENDQVQQKNTQNQKKSAERREIKNMVFGTMGALFSLWHPAPF